MTRRLSCSPRIARAMRAALVVLTVGTWSSIAACGGDGLGGGVGIDATGTVLGAVRFDADGSGSVTVADLPVSGVRVLLLTPFARDTAFRATTSATGSFVIASVPVGSYVLAVDSGSIGDSLVLGVAAERAVTVAPDDSVAFDALVSFPTLSMQAARAAPVGTRLFVRGVAAHGLGTFSDTLLHVADSTAAIRAVRVRPSAVTVGDHVRLRGRVALRDGQPVLDEVDVFAVGSPLSLPSAPVVTTSTAASAAAGTLDARVVRVVDVPVVDTQTVLGSLRVRVDDGSGALILLLDRTADAAFRPPFVDGTWTAGRRFDAVGVLVPLSPGVWALRPRTTFDLVPR